MQGSVDVVTSEHTVGWLFGAHLSTKPVVQAFLQHRVIGQSVAELYRPDLEQVGFGDGRCGFEIRFDEPVSAAQLPFIEVRPDGSNLAIPTTSNGAFRDLVLAVVEGFPGAGRNRSVLGGLWTDRTDAAQVLAGRIAVGSCLPELQTALQAFIGQGHVMLHGALPASGFTEKEAGLLRLVQQPESRSQPVPAAVRNALTALSSFVFRDTVVKLLRAVFDDHPVAYRMDLLDSSDHSFAQACAFEVFPSPAECVVAYIAGPGASGQDGGVQIETLRDTHELGEFGPTGNSRWTKGGAPDLAGLARGAGISVETHTLEAGDMSVIGPGLAHRARLTGEGAVLRVVFAPRRLTPARFLSGDTTWLESSHVSGARVRF